jgi:hypothetical protein
MCKRASNQKVAGSIWQVLAGRKKVSCNRVSTNFNYFSIWETKGPVINMQDAPIVLPTFFERIYTEGVDA